MAVLSTVLLVAEEVEHDEALVPWHPFVYGIVALVLFMVILFLVTRLNIER